VIRLDFDYANFDASFRQILGMESEILWEC
jgi:hypothetical protein